MPTKPFIIFDGVIPDQEDVLPHARNRVRCYESESPHVIGVCHHCGRFLSRASEMRPHFYQDHTLELEPMLQGQERQTAHCKTHAHYLPYSPLKVLIIPGAILYVISLIMLLSFFSTVHRLSVLTRVIKAFQILPTSEALNLISPLVSITWAAALMPTSLFVVGLLLITIGLNQYRIFRAKAMSRPLAGIPLLGKFYTVLIREYMHVKIKLSGAEESYAQKARGWGTISLEIYLTDHEIETARQSYSEKGEKYGFPPIDEFELGWLAVTTSPYVKSDLGQQALYMKRQIEADQDRESAGWYEAARHSYQISGEAIFARTNGPEEMKRALLWVRPVLEPLRGGHTLRLEFDIMSNPAYTRDWRYQEGKDGKEEKGDKEVDGGFLQALRRAKLEYVRVKVAKAAFSASDTTVTRPIDHSKGRVSLDGDKVEWRNIRIADVLANDNQKQSKNPLMVTFSRPIAELNSPLKISFKILIEDEINKDEDEKEEAPTISGVAVKRLHVWLPNGHSFTSTPDRDLTIKYESRLCGTLTIDPRLFAFHVEATASETIAGMPGIPLTSQVLKKLVEKLEKEQVHVKSVIKSAPIIEAQGKLAYQKRSWNILGRFYSGTNNHPIDVYILLVNRAPLGAEGETMTWGSVTYRTLQMNRGKDISEEIEKKCRELKTGLEETLQPESISPQWQAVSSRMFGQGSV